MFAHQGAGIHEPHRHKPVDHRPDRPATSAPTQRRCRRPRHRPDQSRRVQHGQRRPMRPARILQHQRAPRPRGFDLLLVADAPRRHAPPRPRARRRQHVIDIRRTGSVPRARLRPRARGTVAAATTPRPTATIDGFVDVNGVRLHVGCVGSGHTTVLLIPGFEVGDENWATSSPTSPSRPRLLLRPARHRRERPGGGDADVHPQATQLSALLTAIGEPGPYVVVGHSLVAPRQSPSPPATPTR